MFHKATPTVQEAISAYFAQEAPESFNFNPRLPVGVCKSGAGFYIGQLEDGMPYLRLSVEYFGTEEDAILVMEVFNFSIRVNP